MLTLQTAIAYVKATFADSIDSVISAAWAEEGGATFVEVLVKDGAWQGIATVWEFEGQIYADL